MNRRNDEFHNNLQILCAVCRAEPNLPWVNVLAANLQRHLFIRDLSPEAPVGATLEFLFKRRRHDRQQNTFNDFVFLGDKDAGENAASLFLSEKRLSGRNATNEAQKEQRSQLEPMVNLHEPLSRCP